MKNNENPFLKESNKYDAKYENKNVQFARLKFAGKEEKTVFKNLNFGKNKTRASWENTDGTIYPSGSSIYTGIVDANPTGTMAEFSTTEISADGNEWLKVCELAKQEAR